MGRGERGLRMLMARTSSCGVIGALGRDSFLNPFGQARFCGNVSFWITPANEIRVKIRILRLSFTPRLQQCCYFSLIRTLMMQVFAL